ncbi:DUF2290 domain-containing protein [Acinetobacter bereziniae]|uniref:DUF2290 domain-containing protein n=1 Tax=Acinetobacter bereziniae TaxID=106648 RepID=UPI00073F9C36|nr:DUF2290 domain-containing protein [Acinetobacter bereziniae]RSZ26128.1 DUF2290 domain-containing protein [Acinetobacter bereziniae]
MTDIDLKSYIRKVASLAQDLKIDLHHGTRESLNVDSELKKLCKTSPYYREIYDYIINYNQYNISLIDKGCFQFSESRNSSGEQELRYAYYPNPYQFVDFKKEVKSIQELFDGGELTDLEYQQLVNEAEFILDIPLIRYDYSPSQYNNKFHPASHFHIGFHSDNRWPVSKILNPLVFFIKIISMYYGEIWKENFDIKSMSLNDVYATSKTESYSVPSVYFGDEDKKRLVIF